MRSQPVVVVERVLPASCDVVFDEWLSAAALADWMCPRPARLERVQLEPVVGGRYRFDVVEPGRQLVVEGTLLTLERPHTIRFSWNCSTWPPSFRDSIVTVELRPHGAADTHMTIRHELVPPDTVASHAEGWQLVAQQLAERIARRTRAS
jgi:uncharacterized protein YndB with AHSA1/START domain